MNKMIEGGVSKDLYEDYTFQGITWTLTDPRNADLWRWFAHRCVRLQGRSFMVKDAHTQRWCSVATKEATRIMLTNQYAGMVTLNGQPFGIDKKVVNEYLTDYCLDVNGTLLIPLAGTLVYFQNKPHLNLWHDTVLRPTNTDDANYIRELLEFVWYNLCNQKEELDEAGLIAALHDRTKSIEYYFFWHWLAAIYQKPGINLQTNIWLKGAENGIGKGTIIALLGQVFGTEYVDKGSQEDWARGWNDFIVGKLIIECDEFNTNEKSDLKSHIKRDTTNEVVNIKQRGATPYSIPNVANWIFTTNNDMPIWVNANDRRDMWIETGYGQQAIDRATRFFELLEQNKKGVVQSFAVILGRIDVDWKVLYRAPMTSTKADMVEAFKPPVLFWLENDNAERVRRNEWLSVSTAYRWFKTFSEDYQVAYKDVSYQKFARMITVHVKEGVIGKQRRTDGMYVKLPALSDENGAFASTVIAFDRFRIKSSD